MRQVVMHADVVRLIWDRRINPGRVFDLTLPLDRAGAGHAAIETPSGAAHGVIAVESRPLVQYGISHCSRCAP